MLEWSSVSNPLSMNLQLVIVTPSATAAGVVMEKPVPITVVPAQFMKIQLSIYKLSGRATLFLSLIQIIAAWWYLFQAVCLCGETELFLSLIHISEPTRLGMISYAVFC